MLNILIERCYTMATVPIVLAIGKKLYHLTCLHNQVAHMVDKPAFLCGG